jgi:hypothetical protein
MQSFKDSNKSSQPFGGMDDAYFLSIMPIARKLVATTDRMMALSALLSTNRFNVIRLFSLSKLGY